MRRLPLALAVALCLAACRTQPGAMATPGTTTPGDGADAAAGSEPGAPGDPSATADRPSCEEGDTWDGNGDCLYEHGGCCYASPRAACEAAGCSPDNCRILEFRPAQARCEEPA